MNETSAPFAALLLDMDGTLLDTERINCECVIAALRHFGTSQVDAVDLADRMIGLSAAHCDTLLIEEQSREFPLSDFHSRFIEERRQRLSAGIPIKRGAMALISKARALSLPLAIVTSARREQARERLDGAAITPHLDLLITEADVAECKPHPEPYLAAARGLGVSPSRCLVVEDSPAGIASAQAAGMMVVMVPDLIQPDEETRSRCAEVLDDLFAVVRLVERAANAHENRPED